MEKEDKINKSLKAIDTKTDFLLYTTPNGDVKVEILLQDENLWLTQAKIADLFGVERSVVTKHLANIYKEGELVKEAIAKMRQFKIERAKRNSRRKHDNNIKNR